MAPLRDLASSAAELLTAAAFQSWRLRSSLNRRVRQQLAPANAGPIRKTSKNTVSFERTKVRLPTFNSTFGRERTTTILLLMSGLQPYQNPEERSGNLDVPA